jgi:hypothetical protein
VSVLSKKSPRETDPVSPLAAALAAVREANATLLQAGNGLLSQAAEAESFLRADRRTRVSVDGHVAALMKRGGQADLTALVGLMDREPDLFLATRRCVHRARLHIIEEHWRIGTPSEEFNLTRQACEHDDDIERVGQELGRVGFNIFHLVAVAFREVGLAHPDLFGTLTREEAAQRVERSVLRRDAAMQLIGETAGLLDALCTAHHIAPPSMPALLDAAVAMREAPRR